MKGIVMHCRRMSYSDVQKATWPEGIVTTETGSASHGDTVIVLTCIEQGDTEGYLRAAVARVKQLNSTFYNQSNVFVMPFAHLSSRLEHASAAVPLLHRFRDMLESEGFKAGIGTFGSDKDFLVDVIGHRASVSFFEFPGAGKVKAAPKPAESFNWNPILYKALVSKTKNATLRRYERAETQLLQRIASPEKTLIEAGAGCGRVIEFAAPVFGKVIAIEIDSGMYPHLAKAAREARNAIAIKADATTLSSIVPAAPKPVVACLQNTLGTWEGDWRTALAEMIEVAKRNKGELVLSLFSRPALHDFGLAMYETLGPMIGEYDEAASNLESGDFVTKAGYHSHWWSKSEREWIKRQLAGAKLSITAADEYWIVHADYSGVPSGNG